jgi:hypothetical protein
MRGFGSRVSAMVLVGIAAAQPANAGLIGSQVTYTSDYPDISTVAFTVPQQTVTSTTTIVDNSYGSGSSFTSAFTDSSITLSASIQSPAIITSASFNGSVYTFSGIDITGAALTGSSPDFSSVVLTFDTNAVFINLQNLALTNGDNLTVTVTSTAVPEPASAVICGLGLATLGFIRRKRR